MKFSNMCFAVHEVTLSVSKNVSISFIKGTISVSILCTLNVFKSYLLKLFKSVGYFEKPWFNRLATKAGWFYEVLRISIS